MKIQQHQLAMNVIQTLQTIDQFKLCESKLSSLENHCPKPLCCCNSIALFEIATTRSVLYNCARPSSTNQNLSTSLLEWQTNRNADGATHASILPAWCFNPQLPPKRQSTHSLSSSLWGAHWRCDSFGVPPYRLPAPCPAHRPVCGLVVCPV